MISVQTAGRRVKNKQIKIKIQHVTGESLENHDNLCQNTNDEEQQLSRVDSTHQGHDGHVYSESGWETDMQPTVTWLTFLFAIVIQLIQCLSPFSWSVDMSFVTCFGSLPNPATNAGTWRGLQCDAVLCTRACFRFKTVCHWNTIEAENTLIGTSDFNILSKLAAVPVIILYQVNSNSVCNTTHTHSTLHSALLVPGCDWVFNLRISAVLIRDATHGLTWYDLCKPSSFSVLTAASSSSSSVPQLNAKLWCQQICLQTASQVRLRMPSALSPTCGKKRHTCNPFHNLSSETHGAGQRGEKHEQNRNWSHLFLHLLSRPEWHWLSLAI